MTLTECLGALKRMARPREEAMRRKPSDDFARKLVMPGVRALVVSDYPFATVMDRIMRSGLAYNGWLYDIAPKWNHWRGFRSPGA